MTHGRYPYKPRVRLYACIAAANHQTTLTAVLSDSRRRPDVLARREVWQRLHRDGFTLAAIGRMTNRDHTSVLHGLKKAAAL